jgi:hypothetical protein
VPVSERTPHFFLPVTLPSSFSNRSQRDSLEVLVNNHLRVVELHLRLPHPRSRALVLPVVPLLLLLSVACPPWRGVCPIPGKTLQAPHHLASLVKWTMGRRTRS